MRVVVYLPPKTAIALQRYLRLDLGAILDTHDHALRVLRNIISRSGKMRVSKICQIINDAIATANADGTLVSRCFMTYCYIKTHLPSLLKRLEDDGVIKVIS
jgi:hypothetical protein